MDNKKINYIKEMMNMKNGKKLLGAVITLSALSGANTFAKGNQKSKNNGSSTMSCSIDGKGRTEIKKGIKEGTVNVLISLVKDGILSISDAAKRADMSVAEFKKYTDR